MDKHGSTARITAIEARFRRRLRPRNKCLSIPEWDADDYPIIEYTADGLESSAIPLAAPIWNPNDRDRPWSSS